MANKRLDLAGKTFGELRVSAFSHIDEKGGSCWECSCVCGVTKTIRGSILVSGGAKSCGCLRTAQRDSWRASIGETINGWTCLEFIGRTGNHHTFLWEHLCGERRVIKGTTLRSGRQAKCLCEPKSTRKGTGKFHTPTRLTHKAMISRCTNPAHEAYPRYGGAGITLDQRWHDYNEFVKDMGERPDGLELDRIDNSKGYYKDNCRWVTRQENLRNTSVNVWVCFRGKEMTLVELSEISEVSYATLRARIFKYGWDVEVAATTKSRGKK